MHFAPQHHGPTLPQLLNDELARVKPATEPEPWAEPRRWWDHPRLFAWCVFVLALALVTVAGVVSLPGCATPEEADAAVALATSRVAQLKDQEAAATAAHDQAAADSARKKREAIEAAAAAVVGAKDAKPTATEASAAGLAALVPGYGTLATAGIALVGHLWRSGRLSSAVKDLQHELGATGRERDALAVDRDNVIESIEDARVKHPEFAMGLKVAADTIRRRQNPNVRRRVDLVQRDRVGSVDGSSKDPKMTGDARPAGERGLAEANA